MGTRVVRSGSGALRRLAADVAILGGGIAGISAALESARLGRRVVLADAAPALGGQAVGSIIGTFCGLFSNGPDPYQVTHGIADDILRDLESAGALSYMRGRRNTVIVQYREVALARWIEEAVRRAGIDVVPGAVLTGVVREGARIRRIGLATRFGVIEVEARGFVDASGDAALCWQAGLACREPETPIFGTQMVVLEDIDEAALASIGRPAFEARLKDRAGQYGLVRHDGFAFAFPGSGTALVNMTHIRTPLDAVEAGWEMLEGRAQADRVVAFLRVEFPQAFGRSRVRAYGLPGIRQTRWIVGRHHYTVDEVRGGTRSDDAIARCSWPIELHDRADGVQWEEFGDDHMHWVPLGSLLPAESENIVVCGRCIDADVRALPSVRVMGPGIAMGAAAAHVLHLAGDGATNQIDPAGLKRRLHDNLERCD